MAGYAAKCRHGPEIATALSFLDGNPLLPWANGFLVGQSASGVGAGYSAYGRSYVFGASYRF